MSRPGSLIGLFAGAMAILVLGAVALLVVAWLFGALPGHDDAAAELSATAPVGVSTDPGDFAVFGTNDDGTPVRWDPCTPIDIVIADDLAPPGWRADLDAAIAVLHEHTDLDIRVTGNVDETPAGDRSPYQPHHYGDRWAPVLVAWASPGEGLPLRETDRGLGIPVAVGTPGDRVYVSGQVVLNADRDDLVVGDADRGNSWGATVLHELIHVLGLDHVADPDELMAIAPGEGPVVLGPGDRAGLAAIATDTGCLTVPDPRPMTVVG